MRNDAVHISNPSRTGEGALRAIQQVVKNPEDLACISAHGTATLFNDEMEACAIDRAGLGSVPTFSLKGYYGHTMGAAGILETIITLHSVEQGWIPATRGYAEAGTSHEIHITAHEETPVGNRVLKLLSGFGGCNGAIVYRKSGKNESAEPSGTTGNFGQSGISVSLSPSEAPEGLTALYKQRVGDYPKFYKMDPLCKLGFLAVEELLTSLRSNENDNENEKETRAVVLFSRLGSMADDKAYEETIRNSEEYYPSPSVFVYTLSNIVTGEIAIRHGYHGETSCYLLQDKDWSLMEKIIQTTFQDEGIHSVIGGWVDYEDEQHFDADLRLFERTADNADLHR